MKQINNNLIYKIDSKTEFGNFLKSKKIKEINLEKLQSKKKLKLVFIILFKENSKNNIFKILIKLKKISKYNYVKVIFTSSIDVYAKKKECSETARLSQSKSKYIRSKIKIEKFIIKNFENFLILRIGSILRKKRSNVISRILFNKQDVTSLHYMSKYYLVNESLIYKFILKSILKNYKGIFNFVPNNQVSIKNSLNLANIANVIYGSYKYGKTKISNKKIKFLFKELNVSSKNIYLNFLKTNNYF
ncbi:hypothetical protein OAT00_01450 [Pelagibacteraceae bacterium]|nr:hypothetical protein [Pelagibacteraceae bacterium]